MFDFLKDECNETDLSAGEYYVLEKNNWKSFCEDQDKLVFGKFHFFEKCVCMNGKMYYQSQMPLENHYEELPKVFIPYKNFSEKAYVILNVPDWTEENFLKQFNVDDTKFIPVECRSVMKQFYDQINDIFTNQII